MASGTDEPACECWADEAGTVVCTRAAVVEVVLLDGTNARRYCIDHLVRFARHIEQLDAEWKRLRARGTHPRIAQAILERSIGGTPSLSNRSDER